MLLGRLIGWVVQVLVLCLVAGLLLAYFHVSPYALLGDTKGGAADALGMVRHAAHWASGYIALGAVIVLPVAAIMLLFRLLRRL